jgi:hypothetical protein
VKRNEKKMGRENREYRNTKNERRKKQQARGKGNTENVRKRETTNDK